jgi:hypothetical protein
MQQVMFDDLDDAIIGIARQQTKAPLVVYDQERIVRILTERGDDRERDEDEQTAEDEAWDHFSFNIQGTWAGEFTPLILERLPHDEELPSEHGTRVVTTAVKARATPEVVRTVERLTEAANQLRLQSGMIRGWLDDDHFVIHFENSHVTVGISNVSIDMATSEMLTVLRSYSDVHSCLPSDAPVQ